MSCVLWLGAGLLVGCVLGMALASLIFIGTGGTHGR